MSDLPDYQYDPVAYELEEHARPDEMLMLWVAGAKGAELLNWIFNARILDLCCGTGLSLWHLVDHPNAVEYVGVDKCESYISFAESRFQFSVPKPRFILADAVTVDLPGRTWDVVMLASAYHHIEDERKVTFLRHVRDLLSERGYAVMAENVLPEYVEGDTQSYNDAVRSFYTQVLEETRQRNSDLPQYVADLIERVAQYGYDNDYEYKVSYPILMRDISAANLKVVWQQRVWPQAGALNTTTGGNYVLVVQADSKA